MERWNYVFDPCHAVSVPGPAVALPKGHAMVTLAEGAPSERVFFPAKQLELQLVPGEIRRLERAGFAQRYGTVR